MVLFHLSHELRISVKMYDGKNWYIAWERYGSLGRTHTAHQGKKWWSHLRRLNAVPNLVNSNQFDNTQMNYYMLLVLLYVCKKMKKKKTNKHQYHFECDFSKQLKIWLRKSTVRQIIVSFRMAICRIKSINNVMRKLYSQ